MRNLLLAAAAAVFLSANTAAASDEGNGAASNPVTLINAFVVPDGKQEEAIRFWERAAEFMRLQPGYISTALHMAILPDAKYQLINIAKWESAQAFKKASSALRLQSDLKPVAGLVPNPSLYTVIRSD